MSIQSLDNFLINNVFQKIVDHFQLMPRHFGKQCSILYFIAVLMKHLLFSDSSIVNNPATALALLFGLITSAGLYFLTTSDAIFAGASVPLWVRTILIVLLMLSAVIFIISPTAKFACTVLTDLAITAYFFFACCRGPKPKERKQRHHVAATQH